MAGCRKKGRKSDMLTVNDPISNSPSKASGRCLLETWLEKTKGFEKDG